MASEPGRAAAGAPFVAGVAVGDEERPLKAMLPFRAGLNRLVIFHQGLTGLSASLVAVLRRYWCDVLSLPGRYLLVVQLVLLTIRLVAHAQPVPGWPVDSPAVVLSLPRAKLEALLLLLYQLQWCAWSEQLYSLRLAFQRSQTNDKRPWRRMALHVYGGFIFLLVLSGLASIHPLLGIGAMFLLFISAESQDQRLIGQPIAIVLIKAAIRSYRLISHEPWLFLGKLLLPGFILFSGGALLIWIWQQETQLLPRVIAGLLAGFLLVAWLIFFLLAQLQIGVRAAAELDADVVMKIETDQGSRPSNPELLPIKELLDSFAWLCRGLALLFGLIAGGWLLARLADAGLLSSQALLLAFSTTLSLLSNTVTNVLTVLAKLGFLLIVSAVLIFLGMLVISLGRPEPMRPVRELASGLQGRIDQITASLSQLQWITRGTIGVSTLLTVLGTVAVQTYERVQKDQEREKISRANTEKNQTIEAEQAREKLERNEELLTRIQQKVNDYLNKSNPSEAARFHLLSELRDALPELTTATGQVDGERKGRLLRYLYESDLLRYNRPESQEAVAECDKAITPDNRGLPAKDVEKKLGTCGPALFLHEMNFSGAVLQNAYLRNAFLPYINLSHANLRNADLSGAILGAANLENADLSGARITGTALNHATMVGANLSDANYADQPPRLKGAEAFYATYSSGRGDNDWETLRQIVSWDLAKASSPGIPQLKPRQSKPRQWTFCPLDQVNDQRLTEHGRVKSGIKLLVQAGSKCANRFFLQGQVDSVAPITDRDWSGSSFRDSGLNGIRLNRIRLDGADLSNSTFSGVELRGISFSGANLSNAVFRNSVLDDIDFSGANLRGMRFERMQRLRNIRYRGSLVDVEKNPSFSPYGKNMLRSQIYPDKSFLNPADDEVSVFQRTLMLPLLFSPFTLRPQQLLYWMLAYPQPAAMLSTSPLQP